MTGASRTLPASAAAGPAVWPVLAVVAVGIGLVHFVVLQALALRAAGGVFEYPLDDVYIHLAMADSLARGEYGINAGEYASAASSAIYPLLLLPIVPPELQRLLPLFWNVVGLVLSALLWARALLAAGYGAPPLRAAGLALALLGPVGLNMAGVAVLGMEHSLQTAATLAIFVGLLLHILGRPDRRLLFAGLLFAPLLRFEALAVVLPAIAVLALTGARRTAAAGLLVGLLPLVAFCTVLALLGIGPLPNSVEAKTAVPPGIGGPLWQIVIQSILNIRTFPGQVMLFLSALLAILAATPVLRTQGGLRLIVAAAAATGFGHLLLGKIGWLFRYEQSVLVLLSAALMTGAAALPWGRWRFVPIVLPVVVVIALCAFYVPRTAMSLPANTNAIRLQHYQMQDFAKNVVAAPVAVNDLGWVAWRNPHYVLDLWGLASAEALSLRLSRAGEGWAGPLAERHGVQLAMIYDHWLGAAVAEDWVRLGELRTTAPGHRLPGSVVAFYATAPRHAEPLVAALAGWRTGLPDGVAFVFEAELR